MIECAFGGAAISIAFAIRVSAAMITAPIFTSPWCPVAPRIFLVVSLIVFGIDYDNSLGEGVGGAGCSNLFRLFALEFVFGLVFGLVLKIVTIAVETACGLIAASCGLSNAFVGIQIESGNADALSSLYSLAFILVLFAEGIHLEVIRALMNPQLELDQTSQWLFVFYFDRVFESVRECFRLALLLSAPVLSLSIVVSISTAVVNRIMPQAPLYVVMTPFNIAIALVAITVSMERPMIDIVDVIRIQMSSLK